MATTEGERLMGHLEYFNETTGEWTNIEDVPLFDTINCQLCNEPTAAHDIVAEIKFKDNQPIVGTWQCRKCKAVNG
jgi:hypothetical protein